MLPLATEARKSVVSLHEEIIEGRTRACLGKEQVFGAVADSFIARWSAVQICEKCPLSGEGNICHRAGADGEEYGVWGGLFSVDGKKWQAVEPRPLPVVVRGLELAVRNKKGAAMVNAANKLAPGLKDLIYDEHGETQYQIKGSCIIRPSRRMPLPDGTVGSVRQYILTTILCVDAEKGNGIVHTTCSTLDCVSPWHLKWTRGTESQSKGIALSIYAGSVKGWSAQNISHITGISDRVISLALKIADRMNSTLIVPDPSISVMTESLEYLFNRPPTAAEIIAMTHICSAADELDCNTISDLVAAGESEF